jgi:hypothetical protein
MLALAGCGGNRSSDDHSEDGWAYLLQYGSSDDPAGLIASASDAFNEELAGDPNSPDPALGDALCDLINVLMQIDEDLGGIPIGPVSVKSGTSTRTIRLAEYGDIFKLRERLSPRSRSTVGSYISPELIAALYLLVANLDDAESIRQSIRTNYAPALMEIADRIEQIGDANPGVIAVAQYDETRIDIDNGDVLILAGIIRSVVAVLDMCTCYSWDKGDWTAPDNFIDLDANDDNKITPAEYLPDEPYLTLVDAETFTSLGDQIRDGIDNVIDGIQSTLDEEDDQTYDLIPGDDPDVRATLEDLLEVMNAVRSALDGPADITIDGITGTINISNWLSDPPNLRDIAPVFTIEVDVLDIYYDDLPDNTLDNLFPDGMPEDWWGD